MLAVDLLIEEDLPASLETITDLMESEWSVENSRLLDAVARDFLLGFDIHHKHGTGGVEYR